MKVLEDKDFEKLSLLGRDIFLHQRRIEDLLVESGNSHLKFHNSDDIARFLLKRKCHSANDQVRLSRGIANLLIDTPWYENCL